MKLRLGSCYGVDWEMLDLIRLGSGWWSSGWWLLGCGFMGWLEEVVNNVGERWIVG